MSTVTIEGIRWYYRLVASSEYPDRNYLLSKLSPEQLDHGLIVCFTPGRIHGKPSVNKEGKPHKLFGFFQDYIEFFHYMGLFRPEHRLFYEVILGELPQKPHFDLDIAQDKFLELYPDLDWKVESWRIVQNLLRAIQTELPVDICKDVLIYDSNSETKVSYHVIINNHCHTDNKEAEAFYRAVMGHFNAFTSDIYKDTKFIDPCVYKSVQQFRMIGSQKYQSNRIKQFHAGFYLDGKLYHHEYADSGLTSNPDLINLIIFRESLISFVSGCKYIKAYIQQDQRQYSGDFLNVELGNTSVQGIYTMVAEYICKLEFEIPHHGWVKTVRFPYAIREVKGGQIFLRRTAQAWCPLCKQRDMHTSEGSVIRVIDTRITWKCFRYTGPSMFIGYGGDLIPSETEQSLQEPETPVGFCFGNILLSCNPSEAPETYTPSEVSSTVSPSDVPPTISPSVTPPSTTPKIIPQIIHLPKPSPVIDQSKPTMSPMDRLVQESNNQRHLVKSQSKTAPFHVIDWTSPTVNTKPKRGLRLAPMGTWNSTNI